MSLSEEKALVSVEVLPTSNAINVRWENQILRDGEIISTENVRRAYGRYEREAFLADVPNGAAYADAAGLEPVANAPSAEPAA
ncbi:hypothetical protein [Pseudaeromonas paramecii]|uniref:Uncharacterized protein n=1 Tax=Pseudaeromonas paramecii TaxID=2138166 RepID=A0ABP8PWM1_9GAMM